MKLRHVAVAVLAAVAASVGVGATVASATATTAPQQCASWTTHVASRPDSGTHGNWATDSFDRTTTVVCLGNDNYRMDVRDSGSFTTLVNALSPTAGLPIGPSITGSFTGSATATVKAPNGPKNPSAGASGKYSTSEWIGLVFGAEAKGELTAWSWTYKSCGETWVNAAGGNKGDITGKSCPPKLTHTATPKPPVTTTPVTPTTVYYENCNAVRAAGKAPLLKGQPGYRSALDRDSDGIACEVNEGPVKVIVNPGQFTVTPNTSKGIDTGDGSLS